MQAIIWMVSIGPFLAQEIIFLQYEVTSEIIAIAVGLQKKESIILNEAQTTNVHIKVF